MTLDDLTVNFKHLDREDILRDWEWLIGKDKYPVLITSFGDAFLQDHKSGSIYFLNIADGNLEHVSENPDAFQSKLSDIGFVGSYFSVQIVGDMRAMGNKLSKGQVYSFKVPPVLGGKYEPDNIENTDLLVHFSISGQIHEQVKDIPPGAPIGNIKIDNPIKSKPKWKFWV